MKRVSKILLALTAVLLLLLGTAVSLLYSQRFSAWLVQKALERYFHPEQIRYTSLEGSLMHGITLKDIVCENLGGQFEGTVLKIQELETQLDGLRLRDLYVRILNARLVLPLTDPILIQGEIREGRYALNLFSRSVQVDDILRFMPARSWRRHLEGSIEEADLDITGRLRRPRVTGQLRVSEASYNRIRLFNLPVEVDLQVRKNVLGLSLHGYVAVSEGSGKTPYVTVEFQPSRIVFNGDPKNPSFRIFIESKIEDAKIYASLKGTRWKPEISAFSEPALPKPVILAMLVTGKRWKGLSQSIESQTISPELSRDFIDFFLFTGNVRKVAESLGIEAVEVTYEKDKTGIDVKKRITDQLNLTVGVEQSTDADNQKKIQQKIGSEVDLNKSLSIGAERRFEVITPEERDVNQDATSAQTEDRIFFKFKKSF